MNRSHPAVNVLQGGAESIRRPTGPRERETAGQSFPRARQPECPETGAHARISFLSAALRPRVNRTFAGGRVPHALRRPGTTRVIGCRKIDVLAMPAGASIRMGPDSGLYAWIEIQRAGAQAGHRFRRSVRRAPDIKGVSEVTDEFSTLVPRARVELTAKTRGVMEALARKAPEESIAMRQKRPDQPDFKAVLGGERLRVKTKLLLNISAPTAGMGRNKIHCLPFVFPASVRPVFRP